MSDENYVFVWVRGHVEVFDLSGEFICSADTMNEARNEVENDIPL